ncbi:hypothetical protein [Gilvimarinus japonicus]|uniref:Uncharacterized protein n=1 Tax=Gilvimarinus japonicus TaxID=1796469 RepID=A0ABV7HLJ6_9GAMM
MDKKKLGVRALLLSVSTLLIAQSALATTYSYRNSSVYSRLDPSTSVANVTVYTYPVQAYAPIYAWRTHYETQGVEGNYSYDAGGQIVGYTNENGSWSITADAMDHPTGACGKFHNEKFAVGSPLAQKTAGSTFYIVDEYIPPIDFGPLPIPNEGCKRSHWGL